MKNNHFVLSLAFVAASIFVYSCQKETVNPIAEEYVVYEQTFTATERAANTANISWTSTGIVDARFEVEDAATGTILYAYGWIYSNSGAQTANYTVTTGNTVKLRIKARKATGAGASTLTYAYTSSCSLTFPFGGNYNVTAPAGTAWSIIPANVKPTGACL